MMDNLRVHHTQEVQDEIAKGGHQILFRPAYSPDFAPWNWPFRKSRPTLELTSIRSPKKIWNFLSFRQSQQSRLKIVKIGLKHVIIIEE
jgi:transposase